MRRLVPGIAFAFAMAAIVPRAARADINYPAIPSNINPSTVVWFYGCTDELPGACLTMGVGRSLLGPPYDYYFAFYGSGVGLVTPFGVTYSVNDKWGWQNADRSCAGGADNLFWFLNDCFVQNLESEVLRGRVDWLAPNPPPFIGPVSAPIFLTALSTPEPAPIVLVAAGLAAIGGVGALRRRHSRSAA